MPGRCPRSWRNAAFRRDALVHVLVKSRTSTDLPMAALAQSGGAFDFLADEPDLYTDADVVERFR